MADPSTVAIYLIAEEASRHVKTMLSGEGADELFAGYKTYRDSLGAGRFEKAPAFLRALCRGMSHLIPDGVKGKNFLMRAGVPLEERYVGNAFLFTEKQKKDFLLWSILVFLTWHRLYVEEAEKTRSRILSGELSYSQRNAYFDSLREEDAK